jgi:hypothetical protein
MEKAYDVNQCSVYWLGLEIYFTFFNEMDGKDKFLNQPILFTSFWTLMA